jgi:hypothetical protein
MARTTYSLAFNALVGQNKWQSQRPAVTLKTPVVLRGATATLRSPVEPRGLQVTEPRPPIKLHGTWVTGERQPAQLHIRPVKLHRRVRLRTAPRRDAIEVADYSFICIGPDGVWRWYGTGKKFDGYEGKYFKMEDGQLLFTTDIPEGGMMISPSDDEIALLDEADDLFDIEMADMEGFDFQIFNTRKEIEKIVHRVADQVEGLTFKTLMKYMVIMDYDDVIENTDGELEFTGPWFEEAMAEVQ